METKYQDYMKEILQKIMAIDSPSGFCLRAAEFLTNEIKGMGYEAKISNKGCVEAFVKGQSGAKTVGVLAHIDTLGAMVKSISPDGNIGFTTVGSPILPTLDGEYCRIYTRGGKIYTGTFLSTTPSIHVSREATTAPRDLAHMYVRLDEDVKSADETRALGIETGDYIAIEPNFCITGSGFVKSRFLDDKASAAIIMTALKFMSVTKQKPICDTKIIFTANEEVGHGGAPYGQDLAEVLAIDMGCIGADLKCTERDVSICAADSSGPYSYELTGRLIEMAKANKLSYAVDIYPFYSSDVSVMLRAGCDLRGALIGPGVHASHGMERTHLKGMDASFNLLALYLGLKS